MDANQPQLEPQLDTGDTAEPIAAEPIAAEPTAAEPIMAEPIVAEPTPSTPSSHVRDPRPDASRSSSPLSNVPDVPPPATTTMTQDSSSLKRKRQTLRTAIYVVGWNKTTISLETSV